MAFVSPPGRVHDNSHITDCQVGTGSGFRVNVPDVARSWRLCSAARVVDQAGVVPPGAIPPYHRDIYGEVKDRGPDPHVLTGPIEVKGTMPGDVLEVRILDINLTLDWATIASALCWLCQRNSPKVWTRSGALFSAGDAPRKGGGPGLS